ncbi:hypothetical protein Ciccas_004881 [Cichlidogyrus casuarinus]|uniref:PiggyBac transposable element-derived protein domain-containing protein n=1 Tax=Cichlidogyrus casuarinus TaxID=1844966 RepID=A0ABD2QAG2_9PLAT
MPTAADLSKEVADGILNPLRSTLLRLQPIPTGTCKRKQQAHMSRNKYQSILQNLHFADNSKMDMSNRLYKVEPLLEMFRHNCLKHQPSQHQSVDEQMIPYKE